MKLKRPVLDAPASTLIDAMVDGYVCWRERCAAVANTYRDWLAARPDDEAAAFAAYAAALDREESAAEEYGRLVEGAQGHVSRRVASSAS